MGRKLAKVFLIGSGAREHCLAWKLSQSDDVGHIFVVPGNAGISTSSCGKITIPDVLPSLTDYNLLGDWCKKNSIDLVVIGPEAYLADGIVDALQGQGVQCFGPSLAAAQIESSKKFAKEFMMKYEIPTSKYKAFTSYDDACQHIASSSYPALVIKASGLAAGKGVTVAKTIKEACTAVKEMLCEKKFGEAGSEIIVEECLEGEEISLLCFTDGYTVDVMPPVQDHKRLLDGDIGPNTGGMGAYCPCPQVSQETLRYIKEHILTKVVNGLRDEGKLYQGVLYAGLMLTKAGPKVLEFNCRFGDPECQVLLPILESNLYAIMHACVTQTLRDIAVKWKSNVTAVAVVMASSGYPGLYEKGKSMTGVMKVGNMEGMSVFQAGTCLLTSDQLVTSGGRVLTVVGVESDLENSLALALKGVGLINFQGCHYRKDIAHRGINFLRRPNLTYAGSGVSIDSGNDLIKAIAPIAKRTVRSGCNPDLGGFGGIFDLSSAGYSQPILVSGTDGVGTKLLLAQACKNHITVGVDLVAMCVNDILTHNAEPLFFLDYYACGKLTPETARDVIAGVGQGCIAAGCALIGGETAEMPGVYREDIYDLGGFAVGAYEKGRDRPLPCPSEVFVGDIIIGISSSGLHSNGFSLVRKLIARCGFNLNDLAPFQKEKSLGEALLTPTAIYCKQLMPILRNYSGIRGIAHITGGGIVENLPRILPKNCTAQLNADNWQVHPVFGWIAQCGNVKTAEMLRTFNCGLGMCLVVSKTCAREVVESCNEVLSNDELKAAIVGEIFPLPDGPSTEQVTVLNMDNGLHSVKYQVPSLPINGNGITHSKTNGTEITTVQKQTESKPEKNKLSTDTLKTARVAVLISGSGTNLQALINHAAAEKLCCYEISLVISNKVNAFGLKRAQKSGIVTKVIDHRQFKSRVLFDKVLDETLENNEIDFICLAGFMRILSGEFVRKWRGHIVNIHPSLLPSFRGMDAHQQVLQAGVRVTGCSIHFVIEELDGGAIIAQESTAVHPWDTVESLEERVKLIEHKTYPTALEMVAKQKAMLSENENKVIWNVCQNNAVY